MLYQQPVVLCEHGCTGAGVGLGVGAGPSRLANSPTYLLGVQNAPQDLISFTCFFLQTSQSARAAGASATARTSARSIIVSAAAALAARRCPTSRLQLPKASTRKLGTARSTAI